MTEVEAIKKAIKHFECMKNDAIVVLDSGFGTKPGESDLVYRNRKMYAELAISALGKQVVKTNADKIRNMTDEELAELVDDLSDGIFDFEFPCDVCTEKTNCKDCILEWLQSESED